jgi:hypothetical protein
MNHLDINFYFRDMFGRLCVAASAGGEIPNFLKNEDMFDHNTKINRSVYNLPLNFEIKNNPIITSILEVQYPTPNIDESDFLTEQDSDENYHFSLRYNKKLLEYKSSNNSSEKELKNRFNDYFYNFDMLAKRGFYVYDKLNINHPSNNDYVLVSYPTYSRRNIEHVSSHIHAFSTVSGTPYIKKSLITKRNDIFYTSNFQIIDLLTLLDKEAL